MKKLLVLLLTLIMLLSLSACGEDETTGNSGDTTDPITQNPTPSAEGGCSHNIKYTFDGKADTWSHTGQCTICNEIIDNNAACEDQNEDNKCDSCSAKMDFGTAYANLHIGTFFTFIPLDMSGPVYRETPILPVKVIFEETASYMSPSKIETVEDPEYDAEFLIYDAAEFEEAAKTLFNLDDTQIAELRALTYKHYGTQSLINAYDSTANTYNYLRVDRAFGGWEAPEQIGYKKISDTEYVMYLDDLSDILAVNCTYTDTVKVTNIYSVSEVPDGITKINESRLSSD